MPLPRRDDDLSADESGTGLNWPLPGTWMGVYLLVAESFVLWVVLLAVLTRTYR
jgi:hypothetical protein